MTSCVTSQTTTSERSNSQSVSVWTNSNGLAVDRHMKEQKKPTKVLSEIISRVVHDSSSRKISAEYLSDQNQKISLFSSSNSWSDVARHFAQIYQQYEEPIMMIDLAVVLRKFRDWERFLPNVRPYYAVKSNDDPVLVKFLSSLGVGFDCASMAEIKLVRTLPGVSGEDIVFGNPIKNKSSLDYAKRANVKRMTFDCAGELNKIKREFPKAQVILRLKVDDSGAACRLGSKFGAQVHEVEELIQKCVDLKLNLIGISFHVGSGQKRARAFTDALRLVANIYEKAREDHNLDLRFLDIGGGFPGCDAKNMKFEKVGRMISECVNELFPNCTVIAEPGRYFCSASSTLLTKITTKKVTYDEVGEALYKYYINDGVYASFNNIIYDYAKPVPGYIEITTGTYSSIVYGPTCDSLDTILNEYSMPELDEDDFIFWENMGAYTSCASSQFNGFPVAKHKYIFRDD